MEHILALQQLADSVGADEGPEGSTVSPICSSQSNNCVDGVPTYEVI
jgi:hypothetical protein